MRYFRETTEQKQNQNSQSTTNNQPNNTRTTTTNHQNQPTKNLWNWMPTLSRITCLFFFFHAVRAITQTVVQLRTKLRTLSDLETAGKSLKNTKTISQHKNQPNLTPSDMRHLGLLPVGAPVCPLIRWYQQVSHCAVALDTLCEAVSFLSRGLSRVSSSFCCLNAELVENIIIVNIISPQASLNTRPVLPKEIYKVEFWHAHLNYACHRAYEAALPGGSAARLAGDQLCHWNTLAPDSVLKATHLVVFLPPCLGAFVLSNHSSRSPAFFKYPPPELQTNEGLTACVKQVANYPLPSILVNQEEKLSSAHKSAADGYLSSYTIPLLAEPETLAQHAKLNWVLRFPLPPPNQMSTRRFSSTPSYNHGPRTPQALDGALRFASSFTYDTPPVLTPSTSSCNFWGGLCQRDQKWHRFLNPKMVT